MISTFPLYDGSRQIGTVSLWCDNLRLHLQAECETLPGIQRAWAVSGEHRLLIGVLTPDGDRSCCQKSYSLSSLGSFDPEKVSHGDIGSSAPSSCWKPCQDPGGLFCDPITRCALDRSFRYYVNRSGDSCLLGVPWQGGKFPMPGLFCLCQVDCSEGRQMVVVGISPSGCPQVPEL